MAVQGAVVIERAGLKAWPGIEVEWDGAWVRRASGGYTQRANSAQCFDPSDDEDVAERAAATCSWFAGRGLPAIFRVNLLTGPRLAAFLDARGWQRVSHSRVMAMELDEITPNQGGAVLDVLDGEFLEAQRRLKGLDAEALGKFQAILSVLQVPARGIVVSGGDGQAVASGLMCVADGIVVTGNVVTAPGHRRRGHAAAMMRTGLGWARTAGVTMAALNVEADNGAALALYRSLGYRPQYDYVYRRQVRP